LEKNDEDQDKRIMLIPDYLKSLEQQEQQEQSMKTEKESDLKSGKIPDKSISLHPKTISDAQTTHCTANGKTYQGPSVPGKLS
jgi:hypothetical protein